MDKQQNTRDWSKHPLIDQLQALDDQLQLSVVLLDGKGGATIEWLNEPHKAVWGDIKGHTCFEKYNNFSCICSWCPCNASAKDSKCHTALAISPKSGSGTPEVTLEYSQMTSVLLDHTEQHGVHVLEIIVTVSGEQRARLGLLQTQANLIAKTFDIFTHSYDVAGLAVLQLVLAAPTGLRFFKNYLARILPMSGAAPVFSEDIRIITSADCTAPLLSALESLDSEDPLAVTAFYEEKLRALHKLTPRDTMLAKYGASLAKVWQRTGNNNAVRIDEKSAVLRIRADIAHVDYMLLVSHGEQPQFMSDEEFGSLSIIGAAVNHAIALGAMSVAYNEANDMYVQMLKAHGHLRAFEVDQLTPAIFSLAQLMALAQIHELSRAWNDMAPSLENALNAYATRNAKYDLAAKACLEHVYANRKKIGDHLSNLNRIVRLAVVKRERFNLLSLLKELVAEKRRAYPQIRFALTPSAGELFIKGSAEHILMAFDNLLSNAIYFLTEEDRKRHQPEIEVSWSRERDRLRITVYDNGPGIAQNIKHKIFLPLFSFKEKGRGMGLGLPIASLIFHVHEGSINVVSVPGEFTRFIIELPICEE